MKVGITGCAGRMGRVLLRQVAGHGRCAIVGGSEHGDNEAIGLDIGELAGIGTLGLTVERSAKPVFEAADVILDFTAPAATARHAELAAETGAALVAGTTGLDPDQEKAVTEASAKTAIVRAANMSVGVNLLLSLTRRVAATLGPDFDIEILEMHHRHKVDAPSGTALALGRAAASGRGVNHDDVADRGRDGITGERRRGDIGYAALRGGNVAGEHAVIFAADNERVELVHKATDRAIFARGALAAAIWLKGKPPGLYSMADVLGVEA
ncbi:MAG: 4-hydroxy-tetrahydrodipicolinate reductase [Alphaproteobacteria bacterium]|nr:4-hydroxy-tetrahydrodipicolinate reductase [Alphaproteobacteria bacterium]